MTEVRVEKRAVVDGEKLWLKLCDFGDLSWFSGPEKVESNGAGPGMIRRVFVPGGGFIDEKLESVDEHSKTLTYSIAKAAAFPLDNYRAQVTVINESAGQALVIWSGTFDAKDVSEDEAKAMLQSTYAALIDALMASI